MPTKKFVIAAVLFLLAGTAFAQEKFTLEQVMSAPFPDNLAVAKDSGRMAWVFNAKGVRNVWVADAPDFKARAVTHYDVDGTPIASVRLTPDGKTVVYARGSETNRQGEVADPQNFTVKPEQQVWAVDIPDSDRTGAAGSSPRLLGLMDCAQEGCEDIKISPDGQWAVWAARNNLWIAPIAAGGSLPPQLQEEPGSANNGQARGTRGPARQLAYIRGNNRDPEWSPDSKRIAFSSVRGDHSFIGIYTFGKDQIQYMAPAPDRDAMPRWSPDGSQLAYIRTHGAEQKLPMIPVRTNPFAIWVGDPNTGVAKEIWHSTDDPNGGLPGMIESDSFHFTGDRVTFGSEEDGWAHLYSIPAGGGQATLLTPGNFEVEDVAVSHDGKSLIYTSNQNDIDRRHIWEVPIAGGTPKPVTQGEKIEWAPLQMSNGTIVFFESSATQSGMPMYLGKGGPQMIARDAMPADWPGAQLVVPQQVIFKSTDGLEIHGQLFIPRDKKQNMPGIIFSHGGSRRQMMLGFHNMNYYSNAYAENEYLCSLGYVVLSVNYRTGIMYGRAFREAPNTGMRGGQEYQDILAGGRYLQSLPYVDKKKIGLWGGSYGGYLTAMGLSRNSDVFKAGVDLHGVHDWFPEERMWNPTMGVGAPDLQQMQQLAWESSPNSMIDKWTSPVLLIQGDDDRNVPFTQTVDLAQRLREHKIPFEYLIFPDEIHDFLKWASWMHAYAAGADFFNRVLVKGEKIGVPE